MKITSKLPEIGTTIFTQMSQLAHRHKALNLAQGFPGFETDPTLHGLVTTAMQEGYNQYAPMQGVFGLRQKIAEKANRLYHSDYHPENEVTVTAGATQAIFSIIAAFVSPGDQVIVLKPAYDCYEPAVEVQGGKVIPIQLEAPSYSVNWQAVKDAIGPATKMMIINTPHNPTGSVLSEEDMQQLAKLLRGTNIILLSDEVYEHIIFDGHSHQSVARFPELKERSFITASFGKTFHVTGWKMGYVLGPKDLMSEFQKVHQFNVFCANHPMQRAFATYLETPEHYLQLADFYQAKRDIFLDAIKDSKFTMTPASGTYFQLLNYSNISKEHDVRYAQWLTQEKGLAAIPTSVFNIDQKNDYNLRFCFAKEDDSLLRAAEILNSIA